MGPLDLLYCWQALLCAVACTGTAQLAKTVLDLLWPGGRDARRANRWISRVFLPLMPIVAGVAYAVVVPARPEVLTAYVEAMEAGGGWLVYAAWGGACGQFADYGYAKVTKALQRNS